MGPWHWRRDDFNRIAPSYSLTAKATDGAIS